MFGFGTRKRQNTPNPLQAGGPATGGALAPMRATPLRAAPARASTVRYDLDKVLLSFSPRDRWTMRDAFQGTTILGGTGSGKTSGSGAALARAFLQAGFGGLVLCAKPGERALWERYARETGRSKSLIIFGADGTRRFNFLDYELRRGDRLATHNLVSMFMRIMEVAKGRDGDGGNEGFWRDAVGELLTNSFLVLYSAYGTITLADLMNLIMSAPRSLAESDTDGWRAQSFCFQSLVKMAKDPLFPLPEQDVMVAGNFFRKRWATASDRLRSSVEFTFTSMASPFLTGYLREIFATTTNTIPEFTQQGAIIVVDLPIKEHGESGILAQHVWKYLWQRATERRNAERDPTARPLFLWADECQFFVSKYDNEFQSTARGSKAATVYLTQSLPALYERMGGRTPEHSAHTLLNNFQTRIFHQNMDMTTNQQAADMVGREWHTVRSWGTSSGGNAGSSTTYGNTSGGGVSGSGTQTTISSSWGRSEGYADSTGRNWGSSESYSQQVEHVVMPHVFTRLRQGGRGGHPQAVVVQGGRLFSTTGRPYLICEFPQR